MVMERGGRTFEPQILISFFYGHSEDQYYIYYLLSIIYIYYSIILEIILNCIFWLPSKSKSNIQSFSHYE